MAFQSMCSTRVTIARCVPNHVMVILNFFFEKSPELVGYHSLQYNRVSWGQGLTIYMLHTLT